jgi:ABC-type transport system involved in multi-copper enzyme maturation permease subunit
VLFGPVLARELAIAPRRSRIYIHRAAYAAVLLLVMSTAWLVLTGTQIVRDVGDLARFGALLFQILAPLQLALAVFFSALLAAGAVAQEKDRRTLVLLLLTRLSNRELVLGKLAASLLHVVVLLAAGLPLFMLAALLGGVSFGQIGRMMLVTLASVLACGSLGSTLALWREKTFQTVAMTVLVLVLWLGLGELVAAGIFGERPAGIPAAVWAIGLSPWQAGLEACRPYALHGAFSGPRGNPISVFLLGAAAISVVLNVVAVARVRAWNTAREDRPRAPGEAAAERQAEERQQGSGVRRGTRAAGRGSGEAGSALPLGRRVWDNPVLWREVRTWAYGRRMLVLRLAYLLVCAVAAGSLYWMMRGGQPLGLGQAAVALLPLLLLSLVLVNAQAVTSLTAERDTRALDLLLVTDLTPKEIVFGKLGGVFYNTKEMVVLPLALCACLGLAGAISLENAAYLMGGLAVLYVFVAVLGIHAGMTYENSRSAVATSLGTLFFLLLGVAACMRIMVAFSGSFNAQLQPFLAFMVGGGLGLYLALGAKNPSAAIGLASFACPFATFYAITSFLLGYTLNVFLVTAATYGFATAAMLIPAVYEFDVATGRTTAEEGGGD